MAKTAEEAVLPVVRVADRDFPIGPVTIHQIFRLKNVIANTVATSRAKVMRIETRATTTALMELEKSKPTMREALAKKLGMAEEDLPEEQWLREIDNFVSRRTQAEIAEMGYAGQIGVLLGAIEGLTEHQMLELAVILLDRSTHTRITFEWVEEHFDLTWFLEALAVFLEHNNIASIIKNSQRLGAAISMHISAAAKTPDAA